MIYFLVFLVLLGVVCYVVQGIIDTVGGGKNLLLIIGGIALVILAVKGGFIIPLLIIAAFVYGIKTLSGAVHSHGVNTKVAAEKNAQTAESQERHNNEPALQHELETNCRHLGYMSLQDWHNKLPNYTGKKYLTSFDSIVKNFASQV